MLSFALVLTDLELLSFNPSGSLLLLLLLPGDWWKRGLGAGWPIPFRESRDGEGAR